MSPDQCTARGESVEHPAGAMGLLSLASWHWPSEICNRHQEMKTASTLHRIAQTIYIGKRGQRWWQRSLVMGCC